MGPSPCPEANRECLPKTIIPVAPTRTVQLSSQVLICRFTFQGLQLSRLERGTDATRALSPGRAHRARNTSARAPNHQPHSRRSRLRGDHLQSDQVRVHGGQRLRQSLGHRPGGQQSGQARLAARLSAARQLHKVGQASARRTDAHRRRRGQ